MGANLGTNFAGEVSEASVLMPLCGRCVGVGGTVQESLGGWGWTATIHACIIIVMQADDADMMHINSD